jgi:hypothetical protein
MKKLIFASYVTALSLMVPAVFVGYLYNNDNNEQGTGNATAVKDAKTQSTPAGKETSFKPGMIFMLKGM